MTQWLWKLTEVGEWDDEKNDFYVHWLRYKAEKRMFTDQIKRKICLNIEINDKELKIIL